MRQKKDTFLEQIRETITRFGLIERGDRVLVALSGGPDSVALLYALLELKPEYKLKLCAAHLNHKLRGAESDQDERFARELASHLKLKFFSRRIDVKKEAMRKKRSIEETARDVRYRYLEKLADQIKADKIALGHQADDQAETFLMRLVRGAGAAGLSGIPAKRARIIRPLIQIKREEIERFLKSNEIAYRLDSSNYLTDFFRNKVRLMLLPTIKKEFNPRIVDSLNRAADIISSQQEYVQRKCEQILDHIGTKSQSKVILDLKRFSGCHTSLQREMIRLCVRDLGGGLNQLAFESVERALGLVHQKKKGKKIRLANGIWVEVGGRELVFYQEGKREYRCPLKFPGKLSLEDWGLKMTAEIIRGKAAAQNVSTQNQNVAFLDWEKLKAPFHLRNRRRGDRFRPLGMKGTKSLADFLIDAKVPRYLRDEVPILTSRGRIAWVVGHRISHQFKVSPKTKKVLRLQVTV